MYATFVTAEVSERVESVRAFKKCGVFKARGGLLSRSPSRQEGVLVPIAVVKVEAQSSELEYSIYRWTPTLAHV